MGTRASAKHLRWTPAARALDIVERLAAGALLLVLGPVFLAAGVIIFALSGRSPLIAHRRVGWRGRELWVLKFRTMWHTPDRQPFALVERIADETGPDLKEPCDARVNSRFARFCRRHSVDELPQLLHVLRGEMSLVGPRPVTRTEMDKLFGACAPEVMGVKPGLTGLWQVSGRNRLTLAERRALDLQLVRNRSFVLYLAILFRTLPEVMGGANTW